METIKSFLTSLFLNSRHTEESAEVAGFSKFRGGIWDWVGRAVNGLTSSFEMWRFGAGTLIRPAVSYVLPLFMFQLVVHLNTANSNVWVCFSGAMRTENTLTTKTGEPSRKDCYPVTPFHDEPASGTAWHRSLGKIRHGNKYGDDSWELWWATAS